MTSEKADGSREYLSNMTDYSAFEYIDKAKDYITNRNNENPFFLYLPFQSVHMPLQGSGSTI